MSDKNQVQDDFELLKLMLKDKQNILDIYKTSHYWENYEKILVPELFSLGLKDFRRRRNSILSSFGATDLLPATQIINHIAIWEKQPLVLRLISFLHNFGFFKRLINSSYLTGTDLTTLRSLCFNLAKFYGSTNNAKPLEQIECSTVGNPEDLFYVNNKPYTISFLNYYVQYAYCSKFIDFENVDSILEIGSGSGKQVEVIKKLYPNITFYLFDIPPQLYVCERFLSTIFPGQVTSYKDTRKMKMISDNENGKINIFGNWKIQEVQNLKYDLFWNSASFQEMEPDIVENYLKYVNEQAQKAVFLCENMKGVFTAKKGQTHGVLKPTTMKHYSKGLSNFKTTDVSDALYIPYSIPGYSFSFWVKK